MLRAFRYVTRRPKLFGVFSIWMSSSRQPPNGDTNTILNSLYTPLHIRL